MNSLLFFGAAVQAGTPLLFATLGEILTEKSGNLNLGVEGLMLIGAVAGFAAGMATESFMIALIATCLAGGLAGLVYAFLTVTLRANQVVTGLSLTILGTGVSGYAGKFLMGMVLPQNMKDVFVNIKLPVLGSIPFLGEVLFNQNIFVYIGYVLAIGMGIYLGHTRFGLNLRTVGENPYAADASGVQVTVYKYVHIMIGSAISALGGAYLSLVYVPAWQDNVTAGRGWIAVALVIFAMWSPYRAILGAFVFGGLDIIGFRLQSMDISISQYLIDMTPYLVTIIVLIVNSVFKKRDQSPGGLSVSYFREAR
jgi:simple sugar transport system permease protein